ncbi:hypothetical protein K439DRAFT_1545834 [Ramaria rubella]|nr:hypothetical protein K439DRAFT_1545834 [Ramaria rubella]
MTQESEAIVPVSNSSNVLNDVLHTIYGLSCTHYSPSIPTISAGIPALKSYGFHLPTYVSPSSPFFTSSSPTPLQAPSRPTPSPPKTTSTTSPSPCTSSPSPSQCSQMTPPSTLAPSTSNTSSSSTSAAVTPSNATSSSHPTRTPPPLTATLSSKQKLTCA